MTGISNKPKMPSKRTISYLFGTFFLLMSLGSLCSHGYIAGILFFLAAIVTIPSSASLVEKKINISMPGIAQFFIVFLLVAMAFAAFPATPAATNNTSNNTGMIAASSSSVNGSEATAVPAEQTPVTISNSTSNPANTSDATPAPKAVSTPASTPTPTLDNKGKLDILTSPAGATITVDGVSEGMSPIEGLSVDAGTHSVSVYLSGYDPQQEKVEVANSETKKLFYTLVPETDKSTASTSTQEKTQTSEVAATSESSNYQDAQWLVTFTTDSTIVANDMKYVSSAITKNDYTPLSIYANSLFTDSQKAMDDSDLYSVSPDLQGTKDEYRLAMVQANWAAYYISTGINHFNNGDVQTATSDFNQATQDMKSCGEHANKATKLLNAYNSKKS